MGAYHGVLLISHRLLSPLLGKLRPESALAARVWGALQVACFFQLVVLGWLPFRARSLTQVKDVVLAIVERGGALGNASESAKWLLVCTLLLILLELGEELRPRFLERSQFWARGLVYAAVVTSILIAGAPGGQTFIYFQF